MRPAYVTSSESCAGIYATSWISRAAKTRRGPEKPKLFRFFRPKTVLTAGEDHLVALRAQHLDHDVAMVALNLDDPVLGRTTDATALLQPPGERLQLVIS